MYLFLRIECKPRWQIKKFSVISQTTSLSNCVRLYFFFKFYILQAMCSYLPTKYITNAFELPM